MRYLELFLGFFLSILQPIYIWRTKLHYMQNKEFSSVKIQVSYRQFKKAFKKTKFNYRIQYKQEQGFYQIVKDSPNPVSECFANVIKFDNVGYNLTLFGFYLSQKYIKKEFSRQTNIPIISR